MSTLIPSQSSVNFYRQNSAHSSYRLKSATYRSEGISKRLQSSNASARRTILNSKSSKNIKTIQNIGDVENDPPPFIKGQEILSKDIKIPNGWISKSFATVNTQNEKMTRTKLLERRLQERIADPSFDIDGDGVVSNMDLFIALRFDKDNDGKLNQKEKSECMKALKEENFEDRFLFGLDANAPINDNKDPELLRNRTLQVGGKLVRQEFYGDIDDKFKNLKVAKFQTRREMLQNRKKIQVVYEEEKYNQSMAIRQSIAEKLRPKTPKGVGQIGTKTKLSLRQKLENRKNLRIGNTLASQPDCDITHEDKSKVLAQTIPLDYSHNSRFKTQRELKENQNTNLKKMNDKSNLEGQKGFVNENQRIQQKEDNNVRYQTGQSKKNTLLMTKNRAEDSGPLVRTKSQLMYNRQQSLVESNLNKFSYFPKGMHGVDIPAFANTKDIKEKMYWKNDPAFNESPNYQSQKQQKQDRKWFAKNDDLKLYEVQSETFKQTKCHVPQKFKNNVCQKAFTQNHVDPEGKIVKKKTKYQTVWRWTETERLARMKKGYLFDIKGIEYKCEKDPLFSSFAPNQVFVEPYNKTITNEIRSQNTISKTATGKKGEISESVQKAEQTLSPGLPVPRLSSAAADDGFDQPPEILTQNEIKQKLLSKQIEQEEVQQALHGNTELMFKRVQNMGESIGSAATSVGTKRQLGSSQTAKRHKTPTILSMLSMSDHGAAAEQKPQNEITISTDQNYASSSICYTTLNRGVRSSAFTTPKSEIKIQSQQHKVKPTKDQKKVLGMVANLFKDNILVRNNN